MEENIVLGIFSVLPLLLGAALLLFFRKRRLHQRGGKLLLLAGNMLVLAFLCAIGIFSGEVYYRFFYDTTESFGLTKTTARWFEEHFQKNNLGLRDSIDYQFKIRPGDRRVTFLGDSFTAGHGIPDVENRFANIVRSESPSREVHVLAVRGFDTGDEVKSLVAACNNGYEVDLVVLAYCLNDISDISREWQAVLERLKKLEKPGYLVEHSFLCNTLYYRWKSARDPDIADYYQFVSELYSGPTWETQKRRLQSLRDEVDRRGGRLLVVTFPFYHALEDDYRYEGIHEVLDRWWHEIEVPHLDLSSAYESYRADELVVSRHDAHPNERAHAIAASEISKFLNQQIEQSTRR